VHLFGFIIRIYHDARSSEGQVNPLVAPFDPMVFNKYLGRPRGEYSKTPLIRKLVIRTASYPDQLGFSVKFVENSTKKKTNLP